MKGGNLHDIDELIFVLAYFVTQQQRSHKFHSVNILEHVFKAFMVGCQLVACKAADLKQKCTTLKDGKGHLFCIVLPMFELD